MQVGGLWRYPVKSLGGEALSTAAVTRDGLAGDRLVHVRDQRGVLTGRTRYGLLTIPCRTGADRVPLVDGHRWDSEPARALVRAQAGDDVELAGYDGPNRFDVTNLLVATDGEVHRLGYDLRRLRPNLLLTGVPAGAEATWPGHAISIGSALIGVHSLRARCIVTTIDPDTGSQDLEVFRRIRREFGGQLALNAWVIRPGTVAVGDVAHLVPSDEQPTNVGGWVVGKPYDVTREET